jgi:hypothetical protein
VEVFVRQVLDQCFQYFVTELHFSFRVVAGYFYGVFLFYLFFLWFCLFLLFRYCVVLAELQIYFSVVLRGA